MNASEILKLIENVQPDDVAKLDEIDARVWGYLNLHGDFKVSYRKNDGCIHYRHNSWPSDVHTILHHHFDHPKYTRSRDALKAIRPEGWTCVIEASCFTESSEARLISEDRDQRFTSPKTMHTEELAELHAILQTIDYERSQNVPNN